MQRTDSQTDGSQELPTVVLEITRGKARHKHREVRASAFLIGAAVDCDLVLGDPRFGEVHSYLYLRPDSVIVRHLGEGPALEVGGRPVTWAQLADNDRIQLGPYEFRVRIEWPLAEGDGRRSSGSAAAERASTGPSRVTDRLDKKSTAAVFPRLSVYSEDDAPSEPVAQRPTTQAHAAGALRKRASF